MAAMEALLDRWTGKIEAIAAQDRALSPYETMMGRSMTAYITRECIEVVEQAFRLAGGASVYHTCPLERRLRRERAQRAAPAQLRGEGADPLEDAVLDRLLVPRGDGRRGRFGHGIPLYRPVRRRATTT